MNTESRGAPLKGLVSSPASLVFRSVAAVSAGSARGLSAARCGLSSGHCRYGGCRLRGGRVDVGAQSGRVHADLVLRLLEPVLKHFEELVRLLVRRDARVK